MGCGLGLLSLDITHSGEVFPLVVINGIILRPSLV